MIQQETQEPYHPGIRVPVVKADLCDEIWVKQLQLLN